MDIMLQAKKNNLKFDFLIVGQGISGATISLSLLNAGYNVCVIDKPDLSISSRVAAGIWNPIVFKRLTKSWLADDLIPELLSFYSLWETKLNTKLIEERFILKPFTEENEIIFWKQKANDEENQNDFLDKSIYSDLTLDLNYNLKSYSKVLQAGNLNVLNYLNSAGNYLNNHGRFLKEEFNHAELKIKDDDIIYKDICAKKIIFCEGHLILKNPFFNWIPMKPAKGETLTIYCEHLNLQKDIFNKGFFIMPIGNNLFKIGATYEWQQLDDTPTEKGKSELVKKINSVITSPYEIISHDAGVRPSVIDRRPVIGHHSQHKNMYIFNGMGTKAVMIAPYFAKRLVSHFKTNANIDPEVSILRFTKFQST
jgi:glycine oxidase